MSADLIWVDVETTGLQEGEDKLLEIGVVLTDRFGNHIAGDSWLVGDYTGEYTSAVQRARQHEHVGPMHTKNGLWDEWERGLLHFGARMHPASRENDIINFIMKWGGKKGAQPMAGATVHFDRKMIGAQMPELEAFFHYRNFDISTIKQAARWLNPDCAEVDPSAAEGLILHRGYDDCMYEIAEYRHMIDNFFFTTEGHPDEFSSAGS